VKLLQARKQFYICGKAGNQQVLDLTEMPFNSWINMGLFIWQKTCMPCSSPGQTLSFLAFLKELHQFTSQGLEQFLPKPLAIKETAVVSGAEISRVGVQKH